MPTGKFQKRRFIGYSCCLKKPHNYSREQGAHFEIKYEKARGFYGDDAEPFILALIEKEGTFTWEVSPLEDAILQEALVLKEQGKSQRDIAKQVGCSASKVNRMLRKTSEDDETKEVNLTPV